MYSLFFINRSKNRAVYAIKSFFNKPIINISEIQKFSNRLCLSELVVPKKASNEKFVFLLKKAFTKLYESGIKKIVLPESINKNIAIDAGLVPQSTQSIFEYKAFELICLTVKFLQKNLSDIFFVICCDRLTKNVINVISSLITKSRHFYIDCGENTASLSAGLLQNYGIAIQQSPTHIPGQDTVLILFSRISNEYLQYLKPNVIININGQEIRNVSNVFVISGATVKIKNKFIDELPTGINKYATSALLLENGWLNPDSVKLTDIKCGYIF